MLLDDFLFISDFRNLKLEEVLEIAEILESRNKCSVRVYPNSRIMQVSYDSKDTRKSIIMDVNLLERLYLE
jgi:hypothetical protein